MHGFYNLNPREIFDYDATSLVSTTNEITIFNCVLKKKLSVFDVGTHFSTVRLSKNCKFFRGVIGASRQTFANICAAEEMKISAADVLKEVIDFIQRGHSIHDPRCSCKGVSNKFRLQQLGLFDSEFRNNNCTSIPRMCVITDRDIEQELGITAMGMDSVKICNSTIRDILIFSGIFQQSGINWSILKGGKIRNITDLKKFLKHMPCGVDFDDPIIQYDSILSDVALAIKREEIFSIKTSSGDENSSFERQRLFLGYHEGSRCDEDVRKLWHDLA